MKQSPVLRRCLPIAVLLVAACCAGLPASALLNGSQMVIAEGDPVFPTGDTEGTLRLHKSANRPPIAEQLHLQTYKNVAVHGDFTAVDPDGDPFTFQLLEKPARGAVTMPENGSATFIYTPYENKTGKDTFTYLAIDAQGNASDPAVVKIRIEKAGTKVTYADMAGHPAHRAAIRLAEEKLLIGECIGTDCFFHPDTPVSRSEFVALAMQTTGVDPLENVQTTGFADDVQIPAWAKDYAASALKAGLIRGVTDTNGAVMFCGDSTITRAEAAVLLDRTLQVTDTVSVAAFADSELVPVWAMQSAANLSSCGLMDIDHSGSMSLQTELTRGEAAEMLCSVLDFLESREGRNWFH